MLFRKNWYFYIVITPDLWAIWYDCNEGHWLLFMVGNYWVNYAPEYFLARMYILHCYIILSLPLAFIGLVQENFKKEKIRHLLIYNCKIYICIYHVFRRIRRPPNLTVKTGLGLYSLYKTTPHFRGNTSSFLIDRLSDSGQSEQAFY